MESEDETRSSSEMSEGSSFMCNNESMEDTDNDKQHTSKKRAYENETIEDIERKEDKTQESLEDEDSKQYLMENSGEENIYASNDTDEDHDNLQESGKASSSGGYDKTEKQCFGDEKLTNDSSKITKENTEK